MTWPNVRAEEEVMSRYLEDREGGKTEGGGTEEVQKKWDAPVPRGGRQSGPGARVGGHFLVMLLPSILSPQLRPRGKTTGDTKPLNKQLRSVCSIWPAFTPNLRQTNTTHARLIADDEREDCTTRL